MSLKVSIDFDSDLTFTDKSTGFDIRCKTRYYYCYSIPFFKNVLSIIYLWGKGGRREGEGGREKGKRKNVISGCF